MKKIFLLLVGMFLAGAALGCGGDKDKGANKDKDKPVASDKKGK